MAKITTESLGLSESGQTVDILVGTGDPSGVITAVTGSLFFDATTPGLYQGSGGTTWTAVGGSGWPTTTGTDYAGRAYEQAAVAAVDGSLILSPNGTGAIVARVPDGTTAGGNSRGDYAVDLQMFRLNADQVASGVRAVIAGGGNNRAFGRNSAIVGGYSNSAGIDYAFVGGGYQNGASGYMSTVGGGGFHTSSGRYGTIGGGHQNTASAYRTTVGGGRLNTASGRYSTVGGGYYGLADHYGEFAHGSGRFAGSGGDAQYSRMILRRQTTDATPSELSADGGAPTGTDRLSLAADTCYKFRIDLAARENATGDTAWWEITGCIKQGASAATTALVGNTYTTTDADPGAAAWAVAVTADTVNGALAVTVTGEALHTIRWVATVHSTKVSG